MSSSRQRQPGAALSRVRIITLRNTTARSNYWGLLSSFKHEAGRRGSLTLNYTLSRNRTDATNDRDAIDFPQNPLNLGRNMPTRGPIAATSSPRTTSTTAVVQGSPNALPSGARRLAGLRHHDNQLGPADSAHLGEHQRLPPRRPPQHRRRSGRGRPDPEPVLVQPERLRAGRRRHLRQLGPCGIPPAGPQPDRPVDFEELDVQSARSGCSSAPTRSTPSTTRNGPRIRRRTASTIPAPSA